MKIVRFCKADRAVYGALEGDVVRVIDGDVFGECRLTDEEIPLGEVTLLPPVAPGKVIGMGINYTDFCEANSIPVPTFPYIFLKSPQTVCFDGDPVRIVKGHKCNYEAEITVVIKDTCRNVPASEALDHVFGYTICNDMTDKTDLGRDGHMGVAKNYDSFLPLGPCIETDYDWKNKSIKCAVNGEMKIDGNSRNMIFSIPEQIEFISGIMTLEPGDVILSGSPAGATPVYDGDVMAITIEGIGTLTNPVVEE